MIDVSVCIPYAEDWPHLYFTANQIATLMVHSNLTHEIIVCANNSSKESIKDAAKLITAVDFGSYHKSRLIVEDIPSNGRAANACAKEATGKYLVFTDSHVVLHPNIFLECIKTMEEHEDCGLVHSPVTWTGIPFNEAPDGRMSFANNKRCYQYLYRTFDDSGDWYLSRHFHGTYNHTCVDPTAAYPIAGCGHGFFMVRRDVWEKVGGYHQGQIGYGGREAFVTFKMWLMGYRNYVTPLTNHIHYNGRRMYHWQMDNWYRNAMQQAYSIGGEKWLKIIFDSFQKKKGVRPEVIERLRAEAVETSREARSFVLSNQKCEFDDLFKIWDETKIFY